MSLSALYRRCSMRAASRFALPWLAVLCTACAYFSGCSDKIQPPSTSQLVEFGSAGPSGPAVDLDRIAEARLDSGPYRVVPGDVLQVEMPPILDIQALGTTAVIGGKETYTCRISDAGTVVLPVVGALSVAGKSLADIESAIVSSYYPKFVKTEPPVYVGVLEYKTQRVSVVGAVARPGIHALRHDQMSLVGLLMEAGGIVDEGAAVIKISRFGQTGVKSLDLSRLSASRGLAQGTTNRHMFADLSVSAGPPIGVEMGRTDMGLRVLFVRDGPLNATGWLLLGSEDEVVVRRWLDLGSELQRQQFLGLAAARTRLLAGRELEGKLSELARRLESCPPGQGVSLSARDSGWSVADAGHFVAFLDRSVAGPSRVSRAAMVQRTEGPGMDEENVATLVLPVRGLNIPFADVVLQEADSIVVEPPQQQFVSVVGLVNRPGNFPYPDDVHYTLIQAIAMAGGLDLVADPRYVTVYRLKADGSVAGATLQLVNPKNQEQLTENLALPLKPGDVVSVEQTPRTRTNTFLDRIFRVSLGLYFNPESFWNDN